MAAIEEDIFSIDGPSRMETVEEKTNDNAEEERIRNELNEKFIIEGYRSYVDYMKTKIVTAMEEMKDGNNKKRIYIDDKKIKVTINDKTREFSFDFFHYGKRDGEWTSRVQPWTEFAKSLPKFPFQNLQISCKKMNYYLQDLSNPAKGKAYHIILSSKLMRSDTLWHGYDSIPSTD